LQEGSGSVCNCNLISNLTSHSLLNIDLAERDARFLLIVCLLYFAIALALNIWQQQQQKFMKAIFWVNFRFAEYNCSKLPLKHESIAT